MQDYSSTTIVENIKDRFLLSINVDIHTDMAEL